MKTRSLLRRDQRRTPCGRAKAAAARGADGRAPAHRHQSLPVVVGPLGFTSNAVLSENGYCTASVAVGNTSDTQSYIATATPQGAQQGDACGNLPIDNTGQKLHAPTNAAANSNGNCW